MQLEDHGEERGREERRPNESGSATFSSKNKMDLGADHMGDPESMMSAKRVVSAKCVDEARDRQQQHFIHFSRANSGTVSAGQYFKNLKVDCTI